MELNEITDRVIGCAIRVHETLGPGLLESTYEICLTHELHKAGLSVQRQVALPVTYDSIRLDAGYRIDILVQETVMLEIKAIDRLLPIHEAQLLSYLKLSRKKLGLILNFNVRLMKDGIRRLAN